MISTPSEAWSGELTAIKQNLREFLDDPTPLSSREDVDIFDFVEAVRRLLVIIGAPSEETGA